MGCGASAPKEAVAPAALAGPVPAPAPKKEEEKYVPISEQPAVVPLPSIKPKDEPLPEIKKKTSAKVQSDLDKEMDAILNAEEAVALKEEQKKEALAVFKKYDMDGSGKLEVSELHSVMQKLGLDIPEDQFKAYADALMKQYDKDNSGTIEFKEFVKFYSKCLATEEVRAKYAKKLSKEASEAAARATFEKYDVDKSGTIDAGELRKCLGALLKLDLSDEQWDFFAADTLKRGDKDGNNTFDFDEFYNLFKKTLADEKVRKKFEEKITLRYKDGSWKSE